MDIAGLQLSSSAIYVIYFKLLFLNICFIYVIGLQLSRSIIFIRCIVNIFEVFFCRLSKKS